MQLALISVKRIFYILASIIVLFSVVYLFPSATFAQNTNPAGKRIEIDLTNQRLYALEGNNKVYEFVISTGKPWWPTPAGSFKPWIKLRYSTMTGGSRYYGTYYYLPNVPYVIYFYNSATPKWKGYGIHGTYWHNNFGYPMSHGCVNLKIQDMAQLYYWVDPQIEGRNMTDSEINNATPIFIYGYTPT